MTPVEVLAEIERKHGPGVEGYPSATTKPDLEGTRYVTIAGSGVKEEGELAKGMTNDQNAAAQVFLKAVDEYAAVNHKPGTTLVWRAKPELRQWDGKWCIRARLCFEAR